MTNSSNLFWKIAALIFFSILILSACESNPADKMADKANELKKDLADKAKELTSEEPAVPTEPCECEDGWFPHYQTPSPTAGEYSSFATPNTTNCDFHRWVWQMSLYLTKPQSNGLPLFLNKMIHVDENLNRINPQLRLNLVLTSSGKGGGEGVMKPNSTFKSSIGSEKIFYNIQLNDSMFDAMLSNSDIYDFPVESLELKTAWVKIDAIPVNNINNVYTTQAAVEGSGYFESTTVALLGMQLIGRVSNHPEFIWATFQHKNLGPIFNWGDSFASKASTNGIQLASGNTSSSVNDQVYTFSKGGIQPTPENQFIQIDGVNPVNYANITNINNCVTGKHNDVFNNYSYKGSLWGNK